MKLTRLILAAALFASTAAWADSKAAMPILDDSTKATYADIKATLGLVPDMFRDYPPEAIPGAWEEFKNVQLSGTTKINVKYKELIGLAVASQIPCHYCTFFHTEGARMNGATDAELHEAIALAASARHWSTFLHGSQQNEETFRKQLDDFVNKVRNQDPSQAVASVGTITTPDEAYADIQATFGSTPDFFKNFPRDGIVGAWKNFKSLEMGKTAIPNKYKDLIGVAVSSQIPCHYCVYADTAFAKLDGATDDEVYEAVAMASLSRTWSTVLNGLQTDPNKFKGQMKQVWAYAKKNAHADTAAGTTHTKPVKAG